MMHKNVSVMLFTANWARPCELVRPVIELLRDKYGDRVRFLSADIDEQEARGSEMEYAIVCVPTVVVFIRDAIFALVPGARPKREYEHLIEEALDLADSDRN
jgi:thioredoxin 1